LDAGFDSGSTNAEAAAHAHKAHALDEVATQPFLLGGLKIVEHLQQPVPLVVLDNLGLFELFELAACGLLFTAIAVLIKPSQTRHPNGLLGLSQAFSTDAKLHSQLLLREP
jgi:hypothetical protein